ncbi:uncharacterized protein DSM5745_08742 [Aspergillus mulundensis]|uniref:Rhodopsin domain-containing protein n=1 Tax=Aspergillus mulundensis TaxID=1810919 RepID=A0A3D8R4J0_9EURO|nr:hypothetical protein DSM5745_08742 [Aspergillus mulundensis]RDW68982.1 hypothetical protein DSM5745_08742 [Aspergillus mulundensis]
MDSLSGAADSDPAYLRQSKVTAAYIALSLPIPIELFSTGLRLWAELRLHRRGNLAADDFLIIWATVVSVGACVISLQAPRYGFGRHLEVIPEENITPLLKIVYISVHFYLVANACTKLSVLALYHRAFPSVTFRRIGLTTTIFVIIWLIVIEVAWALTCRPIQRFWDQDMKKEGLGECSNAVTGLSLYSTSNLCLDIWIFILPLPLIARLNITTKKKVLLCGLFSVGLGTCVLSAVRLGFIADMTSPTYTWEVTPGKGVTFGIISIWEPLGGILCANLPIIYKPLASGFCRVREFFGSNDPHTSGSSRRRLTRHSWLQYQPHKTQVNRDLEISTMQPLDSTGHSSITYTYDEPMDVEGILAGSPKSTGHTAAAEVSAHGPENNGTGLEGNKHS